MGNEGQVSGFRYNDLSDDSVTAGIKFEGLTNPEASIVLQELHMFVTEAVKNKNSALGKIFHDRVTKIHPVGKVVK